ncbi:tRNA wybutosine-synthesizing protein 3 like protein [Astathelohania contejeani]|uniref:tRNA(Phe) 7-[(3-amino-3-carboxypropyl)-4-demethylwyosine(37)-N(4)]-methyltransferase n=1 Tax=Astathelohania contejeani TaxID=164912 RepID=A0ABQ7HWK7_9MICR|nr:tRNA wybutosine-synthesizing protein 3 like protein [Thelohania contejeani]
MDPGFLIRKKYMHTDRSNKQSIDKNIQTLVDKLNKLETVRTTSSCSGRICLYSEYKTKILWYSHDPAEAKEVIETIKQEINTYYLSDNSSYLYLRFEPFIMHMEVASLEIGKTMLRKAIGCGFRNSGLSIAKKIHVCIRNTISLDVPIVDECKGELLVDWEYIEVLVDIANTKFKRNEELIKRLETEIFKEEKHNS